ncbi:MAG TPA: PqiC family protein [Casimicrobiaceae bacterium]|nr:PqiC family protein [Casimicrobiaceae bacterium]
MDRLVALAIVFALVALVGCASSPEHFYTLSATVPASATSSKVAVTVGPVSVPAAVDRPQIVVSTSANQVTVDDFNRWASPLQDNLARVIAEDLVALLGTPRVTLFPQTLGAEADYRVQIEIRSFESVPGKSAALDAVWTVRRTRDGKTETGRTSARESVDGNGYDALAAAHSRGVARLSRDIAEVVRTLDGAR